MAKLPRKPVPPTLQGDILIECRRRCALCFHFDGDLAVKVGQLAHIDRDPANAADSNLVYLCLGHHDQYDSRPSQTKGLTPQELRHAVRKLKQAIIEGRHLSDRPLGVGGRATDLQALAALMESLSITLRVLRGMSFSSYSFSYFELDGLDQLVRAESGAEHEFIDPRLEALRQNLIEAGKQLFEALPSRTRRLDYNDQYRAVPNEWEESDPRRYAEAVSVLDEAAASVCTAYDELVRIGRARLAP